MGTGISKGTSIVEQLKWRYAAKKYDSARRIPDADWRILAESLLLAPSSYGIQPYKFIVITDPEMREKLKPAAYGQEQITDASHLVVFAYKKTLTDADIEEFVHRIADARGQERDALLDYEAVMKSAAERAVNGGYIETWNSRQAYIALGFLLETAALMQIDASPMEGFDAEQFNNILGLTDYSSVVLAAVGYRDAANDWLAPLAKVRKTADELIIRI